MPKVSVVMAVHNGADFLHSAVASILNQAFQDFEFIVVDDGSTDGSSELLKTQYERRIRLLVNPSQMGLASSLNKGISVAMGEYIARMDHDDISLPSRLEKQVAFLDTHQDADLVGGWASTIGEGRAQIWRYAAEHERIHSELIFSSVLVHSSVMWRKQKFSDLKLEYNPALARSQDFDLWVRASEKGLRFANIPRVLLKYRLHSNQVGRQFAGDQQHTADQVRKRQIVQLGIEPTEHQLQMHNDAGRWRFPDNLTGLKALENWLLLLKSANIEKQIYQIDALEETLEKRWRAACRSSLSFGLDAWNIYRSSSLASGDRSLGDKAIFFSKALFRNLKRWSK